ncbi:MAG: DUF4292 domain-containing protein [Desulfobacteraceae bacterium]|nr:DUF4292 domain-containing protein [Desulfobacteraceae bacterium]
MKTCRSILAPRLIYIFLFSGLFFSLNGCTWIIKPPEDHPQARQALVQFANQNQDLKQMKGLMRIKLRTSQGGTTTARAAWAAMAPEHLRMELLNMVGQPLISMTANGKTIAVRMHESSRIYRIKQSKSAFDKFIKIPIGVEDLITLLCGRPVIPEFAAAQIIKSDKAGTYIVLKNRWRNPLAQINIDKTGKLHSQSIYDSQGARLYHLNWLKWKSYGSYWLPRKVKIETNSGQLVEFNMEKYWTNVQLAASIFKLQTQED